MRIGIFGGSFNPIHNAHVALAHNLLSAANLDEIWMMVSPQNPFKRQAGLMPDDIRMMLVRKALAGQKGIKACDYEMRMPKPSYMWNTLQGLRKDWPGHSFILIIGSDNWERFHEWYRSGDILSNHPVVIYPRPGHPVAKETLPVNVTLADTPLMDISSTEIRHRLAAGESVNELVPEAVADFLNQAYGKQK